MMQSIQDLAQNPLVALLTLSIGALGVLLAIVFFVRSRKVFRLAYLQTLMGAGNPRKYDLNLGWNDWTTIIGLGSLTFMLVALWSDFYNGVPRGIVNYVSVVFFSCVFILVAVVIGADMAIRLRVPSDCCEPSNCNNPALG
jgi:hypothetical protein